jgi:hypothetical protein
LRRGSNGGSNRGSIKGIKKGDQKRGSKKGIKKGDQKRGSKIDGKNLSKKTFQKKYLQYIGLQAGINSLFSITFML